MRQLNRVNRLILLILLLSGRALVLLVSLGEKISDAQSFIGWLLASVSIVGWFGGVTALLLFLIGAAQHAINKLPTFWRTLYPINLGLTFLGIALTLFDPKETFYSIMCASISVVVALLIYYLGALRWRLLPFIVASLTLMPGYLYWTALVAGVGFLALSITTHLLDKRGSQRA